MVRPGTASRPAGTALGIFPRPERAIWCLCFV